MRRIQLNQLTSHAARGIISRDAFFEKICNGIYEMMLADCLDRIPGSMFESMDKIMELAGWDSQGYDVCRYRDLVGLLSDPSQKDTPKYYNIMRELGQLMNNISVNERRMQKEGLYE